MGKFIIKGGNELYGEVKIESAKNAVLPIIASSVLCKEEVVLLNCPKILDVLNMLKIYETLGGKYRFEDNNLILNASNINSYDISSDLSCLLRSSVLFSSALIGRLNFAKISLPGGCDIGKRPIDIHLNCFKELGVSCYNFEDKIECVRKKSEGNNFILSYPSVGATENAIILATASKGQSIINNCAREPEIVDLCNFINSMGGKIYGAGTSQIIVFGVDKLHGCTYNPIHDRIELGTFVVALMVCGGKIDIINAKNENISTLLCKICDNACKIMQKDDIIHIEKSGGVLPFNIKTAPYPNFSTDLQALACVLALKANGKSTICEDVFENRFFHIYELKKMGAKIDCNGKTATIYGGNSLFGGDVDAHDLRCGSALTIAGLISDGETTVNNIHHIDRGYLDFDKKLSNLGANIIRR